MAFTAGVYLPVTETRGETLRTRLDEFAPVFRFSEFHTIAVSAPEDQVYAVIRKVGPEEIRFFKTLMWIWFGGSWAPEHRPILDTVTTGAFVLLAEDPGREIVIGRAGDGRTTRKLTAGEFKALQQSPLVKIAMNLRIQEVNATHCLVSTATRVYAVGRDALRGFAAYWRMIYPGSSLIRRVWLRAIKLRAEAAS